MTTTPRTRNPHAVDRSWFEQALNLPCTTYIETRDRYCGAKPTREYIQGRRCPRHAPSTKNTP